MHDAIMKVVHESIRDYMSLLKSSEYVPPVVFMSPNNGRTELHYDINGFLVNILMDGLPEKESGACA
jgi:hypothetical protein